MAVQTGTYDTEAAKKVTLDKIIKILRGFGANKIYAKKLAPNDNSKNQPYLGADLTDISFIPTGEIVASETTSNKPSVSKDNKRRIKYQVSLKMIWFDAEGKIYPAPNARLIYYPQYPEVRLSGFLMGSKADAGQWMDPYKNGRSLGRWLILGVNDDKTVYSYLVTPICDLSNELEETGYIKVSNVFRELNTGKEEVTSTKAALLSKLLEVYEKGWILGQKLSSHNVKEPYNAPNAAGYTLEAELNITPNGIAEPDYLGWEIKQFNVTSFPAKGVKPVTLMTPEPDGGYYKEQGGKQFVRIFGYPDKCGKPDRLNFGGIHQANKICQATNLMLRIYGFDNEQSSITDARGYIALVSHDQIVAASWSFAKLMEHWKCKHSQVAYVPCLKRSGTLGQVEYHFGKEIELGVGTNFEKFLSAMYSQHIYYDPGIKLEHVSSHNPKIKKRSQFRIKHKDISSLYKSYDIVDVLSFKED
ncbi:MvaI/BcnI restriction endonuclease family protein [Fluoribacter gormanii]|uniref:MvaI/BcnI family restriction endonuclease n=1 Tax=Fluoribacter gormanii TaxID=464 RepID=UPI002244890C|nr:MvaI/BcnI family restriction endonuclease [Fluoribacter gormanii]MCW8470643.1 MvaI/BcnI restriction endonuclease family protein [Fluoribacter gormanii]